MAGKPNVLKVTTPSDREIVLTRVFDAPRRLVFAAYTDPKHIPHWWGRTANQTIVDKMDVRPGGLWRFVQRGPDGKEGGFRGEYREIVPNERIIDTFEYEGMPGHIAVQTSVFKEIDGQTELTVTLRFDSIEDRDGMLNSGMEDGAAETMRRLDQYLPQIAAQMAGEGDAEFVVTRVFDAPRALVFKAWTEAERLAEWWGPKNFTILVSKLDLRPGGVFHYCMRSPDGRDMWGKFVYREITAPERLVFVNSFADEKGNVAPNPWIPNWPLEVLSTLTLEEYEGKTTVTLRGTALNPTELERKTFADGRKSMQQGFKGTWDQLAEYLAKA